MKIIEASQLPTNEKVYLKKDFLGWRVVHPLVNEDGSYNWFNIIFGSKSNLVSLIMLILVGVTIYLGIHELVGQYQLIADNPCDFCYDCANNLRPYMVNITKIKL